LNHLARREEARVSPFKVAQVERSESEHNFSMQVSGESPTSKEPPQLNTSEVNEDSSNIHLYPIPQLNTTLNEGSSKIQLHPVPQLNTTLNEDSSNVQLRQEVLEVSAL